MWKQDFYGVFVASGEIMFAVFIYQNAMTESERT